MSNQRIDLTQFEGKTYEEEYDEMQDMAPTEYLDSVLDMRRTLIAELKRCYERIDALEKVVAGVACVECLSDDGCYPPCSKYDPDAS